jgi:hypothetical protein
MLMPRKAQMDNPLSLEQPRRLLQKLDAAAVVFDKGVVGREDRGDFVLDGERWKINYQRRKTIL